MENSVEKAKLIITYYGLYEKIRLTIVSELKIVQKDIEIIDVELKHFNVVSKSMYEANEIGLKLRNLRSRLTNYEHIIKEYHKILYVITECQLKLLNA